MGDGKEKSKKSEKSPSYNGSATSPSARQACQAPKKKTKKTPDFKGSITFLREKTGSDTYKGQFGFDWMDFTEQEYQKNMMGKTKRLRKKNFETLAREYESIYMKELGYKNELHRRDRKKLGVSKKTHYKYYVPWFSAFGDEEQTIYAQINIKEPGQGKIKLCCVDDSGNEYNDDVILEKGAELQQLEGSTSKMDKVESSLKIKFYTQIEKHLTVQARFYDFCKAESDYQIVGAFKIYANHVEHIIKIQYVRVYFEGTFKYEGGDTKSVNLTPKETRKQKIFVGVTPEEAQIANMESIEIDINLNKQKIKNLFAQALIRYENLGFQDLYINKAKHKWAKNLSILRDEQNKYYCKYTNKKNKPDLDLFYDHLVNSLDKYEKHVNYIFWVPFLYEGAEGGAPAEKDAHKAIGFAYETNTIDEIIVHEIGHSMGLEHTFKSSNKIKFKKGKTQNVMDYNKDESTMLFKWQWDIMQSDPNLISTIPLPPWFDEVVEPLEI